MNKYGIHLIPIHNRNEDYEFIAEFQPRIIKIVNPSVGHIDRIRASLDYNVFENTIFVLRDHLLSEQKEEMARNPRALALEHVERLSDLRHAVGLYQHENTFVEGINEPNLDAGERPALESPAYDTWYQRTRVLSSHSDIYTATLARHSSIIEQRIMAYLFSVGWPANLSEGELPYWGWFENSLDAVEENALHWIGLHEYWSQLGPSYNAGWWAYRWKHMPRNIPVAITECGLDEHVINPDISEPADRGWKNFLSANTYTEQNHEYYTENAKDPRFMGQTNFTSDGGGWESYDMLETYPYVLNMNWEVGDINGPPTLPEPEMELIWPTLGVVTQRFGENYESYKARFGTAGHNGIDLASAEGTNVVAVADGMMMYSAWDDSYGWYVRLYHEQLGLHSFYAHMGNPLDGLSVGDTVKQGDLVGKMSSTGNSTGPHLHFELRAGNSYSYKDITAGHTKGRFNPETAYYLLNDKDKM